MGVGNVGGGDVGRGDVEGWGVGMWGAEEGKDTAHLHSHQEQQLPCGPHYLMETCGHST